MPGNFSGIARIFPLPDLVMFPHVVQPLRVFESRYVELFEDAMNGDRLISMALLRKGWEQDYEGEPPVHSISCLGRVISHNENDDGTYHLLLAGLKRVRITSELNTEHSFRTAEVELIDDSYDGLTDLKKSHLQHKIMTTFKKLTAASGPTDESLQKLASANLSLGMLADAVAYSAPLTVLQKQSLLEESSVQSRARTLIAFLNELASDGFPSLNSFPPEFSEN
jgi:Lon protease-like protein